ncbi:MAG: hypothetical protein V9H26_13495 [Verrucomicrobiota bacterium]|nr:hypothetical protein [Verrucomicrobiota bacterium]MCC6821615.1 hypothetical protein [Limisphaerales bacterium]
MKTICFRLVERRLLPDRSWSQFRQRDWRRGLLSGGIAILGAAFFAGCATSKPASASFASVVIPSQSVEKIQSTTLLVFQEAGFKSRSEPGGAMVFEKEGSRGDQIVYGDLGGAAYGGAVTVRVRAEIVDLIGQDAHRLQCTAYIVNHAGDGVFEDKQRLANFRRGPYQKLLDEVAGKLK